MSAQFLQELEVTKNASFKFESRKGISGSADEIFFLRLPEVKAVTGLSKSSLYALIRTNNFPAPVRLAPRAVAWVASEVRQWAAERVLISRSASSRRGDRRKSQPVLRETLGSPKRWA
jgi:prophage regulatory protein